MLSSFSLLKVQISLFYFIEKHGFDELPKSLAHYALQADNCIRAVVLELLLSAELQGDGLICLVAGSLFAITGCSTI